MEECAACGHTKNIKAKGMCSRCYELDRQSRMPACSYDGCDRPQRARGLCHGHGAQRRRGEDLTPLRRLEDYRKTDDSGYVVVGAPTHPNANAQGYIFEHRLVMSTILDRPLLPGENVHHRNGVRDDNRPENLELWVTLQPAGQRVEDLLNYADEIIRRYR